MDSNRPSSRRSRGRPRGSRSRPRQRRGQSINNPLPLRNIFQSNLDNQSDMQSGISFTQPNSLLIQLISLQIFYLLVQY